MDNKELNMKTAIEAYRLGLITFLQYLELCRDLDPKKSVEAK